MSEQVTYWGVETTYNEVIDIPIEQDYVEISAECEVPYLKDGRRVRRTRENAYYPPLISWDGLEHMTLHADTAREVATALNAAADACDACDGEPDNAA